MPRRVSSRPVGELVAARLARELAALAAEGLAPTRTEAGLRLGWSMGLSSQHLGTMLRQQVIAPGERLPHTRGGASRLLWPGPRAAEVLSPEEVAAWEAARQVPPEEGVVTVAGEQRRVVDGVALGTVPGGDWRLRRGGVAVREDGKTGRWEA